MKHCLAALLMAALFVSCVDDELIQSVPYDDTESAAKASDIFVSGEAHIYLSEDMAAMIETATEAGTLATKSAPMNKAIEELGITRIYRLFPHAGEFEPRTRAEGLHRWYVIKYSEDMPETKAQTSLENISGIEIFEPVRQIKNKDFNDLSSSQWGLYNTSTVGVDINVKPVWDYYTTGSNKVIVSVVDNGIDMNHEDLSANCLSTGNYNAVDNNSVIVAGDHGTHVAGIIAAGGNNGKGIAGIAGGDKQKSDTGVKLMSCQIFKTNADGTTSFGSSATAIKWGADNGAVISQNSWGYTYDADEDGKLTGEEMTNALSAKISASDRAAVDYFIKYAGCDNAGNQLPDSPMKGGVVIFAAGNEAITNDAPSSYSEIIAVGSIASDGTRSSFSNYGDWVDICAPGSDIYSTLPGNSYGKMSGTSMACPHVSGVAALIVSHLGGPGFTNEMLKEKLLGSANKSIISQAYQIGGLVDAYGAFVYGNDKAPQAVTDLEVSGRGNSIVHKWTIPADEDGKGAYGFLIIYDTDREKVENATANELGGAKYVTITPEAKPGDTVEYSLSGLEFERTYYLKMTAYSYGRNYSESTEILTAETTENNPPMVEAVYDGDYVLMPSETLNITITAVEPDGHSMTVTLTPGSDAESMINTPDGNWRLTIKGSAAPQGTYTANITATDEFGLSTTLKIEYTIRENQAPVKTGNPEDLFMKAKGEEILVDMSKYVNDPDGEQLKYETSMTNRNIAHINAKGDQLIITALSYGSTDVTIKAEDARGESVSVSFKILVKDPSDPLTVYPNPVTDYVYVSTLDSADTDIKITSQTGKTMFENTMEASAFEPAKIDMSTYAPGVYIMTVTFDGSTHKETIIKI